ncbi:MAG: isochorismatase family protein [Bauldia sp.]|nr:isochorismatase family protein [Bauldia sp.]
MALPRIEAYDLPTRDELPPSRLRWTIDPARAALLIHDMQNHFAWPFAGDSPLQPAIGNIAALRDACRAIGAPVFFSAQTGNQDPRDRGLQRDVWGPGMDGAPESRAIVNALAPGDGDIVLTKWRYSAFQRTPLAEMLAARGRDQLIVTGIYAHIGCLLTAADAFMRDIEPFFVADAVADFSRAHHDRALAYVAELCGRPVVAAEALDALRGPA